MTNYTLPITAGINTVTPGSQLLRAQYWGLTQAEWAAMSTDEREFFNWWKEVPFDLQGT